MEKTSKQVIVIRKDLKNQKGEKIRSGKIIAQACHASMAAVLNLMEKSGEFDSNKPAENNFLLRKLKLYPGEAITDWLEGRFTKICVSVNSEEELLSIYQQAKDAGLICALITDAGLTEFAGVPTKTCCAIGPCWSDEVDKITGKLSLL